MIRSNPATDAQSPHTPAPSRPEAAFTLFVDHACPLCRREADFMRRLDRGRGKLRLMDISPPDFDASAWGRSRAELMSEIHGVTSDGRIVRGMDAFRRAYAALGWGWLLGWTAWPGARWLADRAYAWFARNRLRLTGRCNSEACSRTGG